MKKLIAYFSASGITAAKAHTLAAEAGTDLYEIRPADPYTEDDLNWNDTHCRANEEMQDVHCRPALAEKTEDLSAYDEIAIGYPIWWGTAPRIINTFLESTDFSGKKIVLFATSGGSGIGKSVSDLQEAYPAYDIREGALLNGKVRNIL